MGRGGGDGEGRKVSGGLQETLRKHRQARKPGRREGPKRPQAGQGPGDSGLRSPSGVRRVMGKRPWAE